ncbi:MAG: hypothetical protein JNN25_00110 [Candidatus Kapabacteria bacterium]|nr:hypothetical protein [Candidatus Kapabacteria bacterium]
MKTITLQKRDIDLTEYKKRTALESDYTTLYTGDVKIVDEASQPIILYKRLTQPLTELLSAVQAVHYERDTRTNGLKTTSAIFGYNSRNVIRKDYCSATRMSYKQPQEHAVLCEFAQVLTALYTEEFPEIYAKHEALVQEKILPEWKIGTTPFTSGIVNKNNALKYHFDSGNFAGVLSNMIVLKHGVEGGHLSCPEYDCAFEVANGSVVLFDGQKILHGVTPIRRTNIKSYRYSVVYYTLQQMWQCKPIEEETQRIRATHTERERKRAKGDVMKDDLRFTRNHPTV